jgi:tetratricopeptide (TPR) repeat protein
MAKGIFGDNDAYCHHIKLYLLVFFLFLNIGYAELENPNYRTINIKIAPELTFKGQDNWKQDIDRILDECDRIFKEQFRIRLIVKEVEYWKLENGICSIRDSLCDLRKKVLPKKRDVILGLVPDNTLLDKAYGISSDYHGYVLIKYLESKESMKFALLHELCHIFGAPDINEIGSIMDIKVPILNFDEFTTQIIRLNRNRSFKQDSFPLSWNQLDESISLLKQRSELNRNEPGVHTRLALLYLEKNDISSAEHECNNAIRLSPYKGQLHNILGTIYHRQGQFDRAIEEFRVALKYLPKMPEIHLNMGLAYSKMGEVNNAITEFRKAIQINPYYSNAHASLCYLCFKKQRYEPAIRQGRTALEFCPNNTELLCTIAASLILKFDSLRREKVHNLNQERNANFHSDSKSNFDRSDEEGLIEEALGYSIKATEIAPGLSEAYNLSGVCYTYQNRFEEAEREFLKALELNPDFVQVHYNLGYLYYQNKFIEKTAYHLKKIFENSNHSDIRIRLMDHFFARQSGCLVSSEH